MMKNKKIAALLGVLLAGSMAFSLSACGFYQQCFRQQVFGQLLSVQRQEGHLQLRRRL